ncbi:putative transcriptional regulatory protein [Cyphellophora attinorum]|uniref:Putative transcriptional regulatory protein n=1 Tax=Cyphellophora attinorum TaxID=1664694 RepID=A0A0N0NHR8_9EURO|nr:putative transcriptional regulatory protein [Phialophora attinorum]KPI35001.1 putative transcriptional regulatory protein [Phialophora attinorum]
MSDISNFTGRFRVQGPEGDRVVKRPRATLTCAPCRSAKLGCDKKQPCSSCVKRGDVARCVYTGRSEQKAKDDQNVAEQKQKLAHLEAMVIELMQEQRKSLPSEGPSNLALINDSNDSAPPVRPVVAPQNGYAGSTHWSAMLRDIQELRGLLDEDGDANAYETPVDSPPEEVIHGLPRMYSIDQIIDNHMPPKNDVERLLSVYFNGETFILPILHTGYFQRQCNEFWKSPSEVQPLWLSMLFSLCFMAARVSATSGSTIMLANPQALQVAAGECLVLGHYNLAQQLAPEALLLYAQAKHFHSLDSSPEVGAILAMSVRHAYRLGYHRDPDVVGSFSPFEGEMRRRFWATCKQMDLMLSFQLGLPSNIRLELSDTQSPRNLLDSDFDESSVSLPPSRPESELRASCGSLSRIDSYPPSAEMHAKVPQVLRVRPFAESAVDSPFLVMTRLYVELTYLKNLCVLHRPYMPEGRKKSITSGAEAARAVMNLIFGMYAEFAPGGQLESTKWMLNCFTVNDFLFGITTACLAVYSIRQDAKALPQELLWSKSSSQDAKKVAHAIGLVLNGLGSGSNLSPSRTPMRASATFPVAQPDFALPLTAATGIPGQYDPFDFINNPIGDAEWAAMCAEYGLVNGDNTLLPNPF